MMKEFENILNKLASEKFRSYIKTVANKLGFLNIRLYNAEDNNLNFFVDQVSKSKDSLDKAADFKLLLEDAFDCSVFVHVSETLNATFLKECQEKSISIDASKKKMIDFYKGGSEFNEVMDEEDWTHEERTAYVTGLKR